MRRFLPAALVLYFAAAVPAFAHFTPIPLPPHPAPVAAPTDPMSIFIDGLASGIKNNALADLIADIQAADVDAKAHGDTISDQCYQAEITFANGIPAFANPTGSLGPVQLFQIKRDIQNAFQGGVPKSLVIGCGPLFMDEQAALVRFAAALAAVGIVIPK